MRTVYKPVWAVTVITVAVLMASQFNLILADDKSIQSHVIEIRNLEFTPKELTVAPGDTITWVNYDLVPHTVTADDESWDSDLLGSKEQWQTVIKENMYESYYCRYHPSMTAHIRIIKR
jgi:plastocyanin